MPDPAPLTPEEAHREFHDEWDCPGDALESCFLLAALRAQREAMPQTPSCATQPCIYDPCACQEMGRQEGRNQALRDEDERGR